MLVREEAGTGIDGTEMDWLRIEDCCKHGKLPVSRIKIVPLSCTEFPAPAARRDDAGLVRIWAPRPAARQDKRGIDS